MMGNKSYGCIELCFSSWYHLGDIKYLTATGIPSIIGT